MDVAGPLAALIGLVAFVFAAAVLCHWLLEPVNRAAGHLNAPTRFQLTDFIWLMMQLQIMLAVVIQTVGEAASERGLIAILVLLSLPLVVLWAASVSVVSRAGIKQPLRRAVVILLLVPGSLAEVIALPVLVVGGLAFVSNEPTWMWQSTWAGYAAIRVLVVLIVASGVASSAFLIRWLSFWVLAGQQPQAAALKT